MSKLGTKNIKTGGGFTPKNLQPGNHACKILKVSLREFKFKPGGYDIILDLEGPDLGKEFEGFYIDNNDQSKGRHKGQFGNVKASEWAFADGETKTKIAVSRDEDMLKFLKNFCTALDRVDWLDAQDNKHDTIESLVGAFTKDAPYKDVILNFCIAGKEYTNKQGYTAYELFLPKYSKDGAPFEPLQPKGASKLQKFDETKHIKRKKVENVSEFGEGAPKSEFEL